MFQSRARALGGLRAPRACREEERQAADAAKAPWRKQQEQLIRTSDPGFSGSGICPISPDWNKAADAMPQDLQAICEFDESMPQDLDSICSASVADEDDDKSDTCSVRSSSSAGSYGLQQFASSKTVPLSQMLKQQQQQAAVTRMTQQYVAAQEPKSPEYNYGKQMFAPYKSSSTPANGAGAGYQGYGYCDSPDTPLMHRGFSSSSGNPSPTASGLSSPFSPASPLHRGAASTQTREQPQNVAPGGGRAGSGPKDPRLRQQLLMRAASNASSVEGSDAWGADSPDGESQELDFSGINSQCLNFDDVETYCRGVDKESATVEGLRIVPMPPQRFGNPQAPELVLYALYTSKSTAPVLPGDSSTQMLFPAKLQQEAAKAAPVYVSSRTKSIVPSFGVYQRQGEVRDELEDYILG